MFPSDEGPTLKTLNFAFRLSAVYQPFISWFLSQHFLRSTLCLKMDTCLKKDMYLFFVYLYIF